MIDEKGLQAAWNAYARERNEPWQDRVEAAITAYLSASAEPVVEFKLVKRPVAFRVKAPADTGWQHLYYRDEQNAAEAAEQIGVDYEGLYVRDGTPLYTHPGAPNV